MICENAASVYTAAGSSCDGWKGITLEECKAKCTNNEVPNSECPRQSVKCAFVRYTRNWGCHLADDSCKPIQGDARFMLFKKPKQKGEQGSDNMQSLIFPNF